MRRTSLVLAVVAAMVTVLVFTAPAFAIDLGQSNPSGPGGTDPETGEDSSDPPDNIGGRSEPQAPEGTGGGLASGYTSFEHEVGGVPGHHLIETLDPDPTLETPGDLVQSCRGDAPHPLCYAF